MAAHPYNPGPCTAHAKPGLDGSFIEPEPKLILLQSGVPALHLDPDQAIVLRMVGAQLDLVHSACDGAQVIFIHSRERFKGHRVYRHPANLLPLKIGILYELLEFICLCGSLQHEFGQSGLLLCLCCKGREVPVETTLIY